MSNPSNPNPVKLVSSIFSADTHLIVAVVNELSAMFGMIDYISELIPFEYTDYYVKEMGPRQKRRFVSFENLLCPDTLPAIKLSTNALEETFSAMEKRKINIDPGYISLGNLVLATGKPFAHRPYLGSGIYADLTLVYQRGGFHPLEWTYPDYRECGMLRMLAGIRGKYLIQLTQSKREALQTI